MNKGKQSKEKKKKSKKKKKLLWKIILIIVLILSAIAGVIAYRAQQLGGGLQGIVAATLGHTEETKKNLGTIEFIAFGKSQNLTDTIIVCSYNPNEQTASMLSIPRDTFVGKNKNSATASNKINSLYQSSPQKAIDAVNKITGLNIQYYAMIDTASLRKVVDAIGGVYYDVPINMLYDDDTQKLHINLKKGYQLLDGDQAEQLVRFRHGNNPAQSYPEEWGDQDLGRMRTQREFITTTLKQTLQLKNIFKLGELIDIAHKNLETNIPLDLAKDYLPYAIEFNTENIRSETLPGTPERCNGVWIYTYDKNGAEQIVNELFLNTEKNTEKNTDNNSNNIKIELLNGSGNKSLLTEVTNLLKEKGYNITKSATTTSTSKTTIINRTNQPEEELNNIKQILETGNITKSDKQSNGADFTIIIGKDYKQ